MFALCAFAFVFAGWYAKRVLAPLLWLFDLLGPQLYPVGVESACTGTFGEGFCYQVPSLACSVASLLAACDVGSPERLRWRDESF